EPWLHEGSAEAFSWLTLYENGIIRKSELINRTESSLNRCLAALRGRSVSQIMSASEGPYLCGAFMNMAIDAGLRDRGGLFGLWQSIFEDAKSGSGYYDEEMFFRHLDEISGNRQLSDFLQKLLHENKTDMWKDVSEKLDRIGAEISTGPGTGADILPLIQTVTVALMEKDCEGRFSVSRADPGFLIHGMPGCKNLPADEFVLTGFNGYDLLDEPSKSYGSLLNSCEEHETVVLDSREAGESYTLGCPDHLSPYLQITSWP
ncbi:MAG: hypothetical protein ACFCU6_00530, partial [Balneolaceae bacterium]